MPETAMLEGITDTPRVVHKTIRSFVNERGYIQLPRVPFDFTSITDITIVTPASQYNLGLIAQTWFEEFVHIGARSVVVSEFSQSKRPFRQYELVLFLCSSGNVRTFVEACKRANSVGYRTLALVNDPKSELIAHADGFIVTAAGKEENEVSTKIFTTQLAALACLAIGMGEAVGVLPRQARFGKKVPESLDLRSPMRRVLKLSQWIRFAAQEIEDAQEIFFLGSGSGFPLALEATRNFQNMCRIPARCFPVGEVEYQKLNFLSKKGSVVTIAPPGQATLHCEECCKEIVGREGGITLISNPEGNKILKKYVRRSIVIPTTANIFSPVLYSLTLQLLAYHVASGAKRKVDKPSGLTSFVTA